MKRSDAFPSKYLSKEDVPEPISVTVKSVALETLNGGNGDDEKETKPVMTFAEQVKPMILNNANWSTIEAMYGDDSDGWIGKRVTVYVDPSVMFGKKRVGGLRVQYSTPTPKAGTNGGNAKPPFSQPARTVDNDRPAAPDTVRKWLNAKHDEYLTRPVPDQTVLEKMRGLATGTLTKWFDEDRRHWILDALFGSKSSKDLNYMQLAALLWYLALERGADGKYAETERSMYAKAELSLILDQYQIEQGQEVMGLAA